MNKNTFLTIGFLILFFWVYKDWFSPNLIAGGDFWPQSAQQSSYYQIVPYAWNAMINNGLGGNVVFLNWNHFFVTAPIYLLGTHLHLPYEIVERLGYLFPLILLALYSSFVWTKYFFKENSTLRIISALIYNFNTYILLIIGGGQLGISFAYVFAPLVVLKFVNILKSNNSKLKISIIAGLFFAIQILFDLRVAYITFLVISIYFLFSVLTQIKKIKVVVISVLVLFYFFIPLILTLLIHAYWIVPQLLSHTNSTLSLGDAFVTTEAVKFFSFAKIEDTLGLLHPLWPENIFGKVSFMKAEFLLLPLLAFNSLLFFNKKSEKEKFKNQWILFFSFLGLVGIFLAKGANEPFGQIYLWLFEHVPGFVMFRDPTKFYLLIVISYSVLIPFGILGITERFKKQKTYIYFLTLCLLIFLMHPIWTGNVGGIFKSTQMPNEYADLTEFINSDNEFSRVLWTPKLQRFGYYSPNHPAVNADEFFKTTSLTKLMNVLQKSESEKKLEMWGVKYVVIPYDINGEIFQDDRKYSEKQNTFVIKQMKQIRWLTLEKQFGKILVFKVASPSTHFSTSSKDLNISSIASNATQYDISLKDAKKGDTLLFRENFDSNWVANDGKITIPSKNLNAQNSFLLNKDGNYTLRIWYPIQKWVLIGMQISAVSLGAILLFLFLQRKK